MNEKPVKKQNFLQGTAILATATLIVKLLGFLYKTPLIAIIGKDGYGYFTTAYEIYSVLLMVSTTGLPVAMSRMISESRELGNTAQIRQIFRTSLYVFITIGIIGSALMLFRCSQLSNDVTKFDTSWAAIACLSPSVLLMCIMAAYRGFFQGQSNMTPTSVSQVLEAICKLLFGLGAAWGIMHLTKSVDLAPLENTLGLTVNPVVLSAGGAILGVTLSCVVSVIYLSSKYRHAVKNASFHQGRIKSRKKTLRELLAIAVPITLGAAGLQLINLIDTGFFMGRLVDVFTPTLVDPKLVQQKAEIAKGIYNYCQTIFNLPCAFIPAITISIIPAITEHLTRKNDRGAKMVEDSAMRLTGLIAMPCAVGLAVLSGPVLELLISLDGDQLVTGSRILSILGVSVIFNSLVLVSNAIMQAHGHVTRPVIHMLIGGVVKVLVNYWLVGIPELNITGAAIGTVCCYAVITVLNLVSMARLTDGQKASPVKSMIKPLLAALAMGLAAYMSYHVLHTYLSSQKLACLAAVAVGVVVYGIFVFVLRVITYEDCMLLPKGEKIAKILRIH